MQNIGLISTLIATAVFLGLTYKAACIVLATRGRCRLLCGVRVEMRKQGRQLAAEVERIADRVEKRKRTDVPAAIGQVTGKQRAASRCELPSDYQPLRLLRRILEAALAGAEEVAWDELRHWLQRLTFNASSRLTLAKQAKEFGLLFTVIGALLAFGSLSQMSKPFEVFGALSLAMVTTIVGLLLSLLITHCVQRFYTAHGELKIESEQAVLMLLRSTSRLQGARREHATSVEGSAAGDHSIETWFVMPATAPSNGNGGLRCVAN